MKRVYVILISMTLVISALAQGNKESRKASMNRVMPGVVVLKLKPDEIKSQVSSHETQQMNDLEGLVNSKYKFEEISNVFTNTTNDSNVRNTNRSQIDFSLYRKVKFDDNIDPRNVAAYLSKMSKVEYAEPLYLYQSHYTPNDTELSNQTYLDAISAEAAWEISKGSSDIVVAIIDSGVDYEHPDLQNKIFINEGEIPENGVDDDADGYIDNYYGWDFAGSDFENVVEDNDPIAQSQNILHGTAVAGCAAADTDNGIGVAGMGFNARYMALKCSAENDERDNGSAFLLNTNLAVIYAADHGADVINMSYGSSNYSQFSQDVMTYAALEKGVVLVASAGNSGINEVNYPAAYDNVLSVANTRDNDLKASSSTYGSWVDISAPGTQIRTTGINNTYINISGTSFSSPITAGAAALVKAHFPEYNQFQIRQLLIQTSDDIDGLNPDFTGLLGKGRLNMHRSLTVATPAIEVTDFQIVNAQGEVPAKGEEATISFNLTNQLASTSSLAELKISEQTGIDFGSETTLTIGELKNGEVREISGIKFTIPDTVLFNETMSFIIDITDRQTTFATSQTFGVIVNPLLTEVGPMPFLLSSGGDFESDMDGFKSAQIFGDIDVWEKGIPTNELTDVNSGSQAWKTGLNENLPKASYRCVLQSPLFDFSDESKEYRVSFYKSMESEFCNAPAAVQVQYSTDGLAWIRLGEANNIKGVNWYNKSPESSCAIDASIMPDQQGWIGNFNNEYTAYNVSELAGNDQVMFRFLLSVSGSFESDINDDGFMVDDFQVETFDPSANFNAKQKLLYIGKPVEFEFLSNGANSFSWDFGDGNTSTEMNPVHYYNEAGVYDVSLTITTAEGTVDSLFSNYITVLPMLKVPYTLEDGGNFEVNSSNFGAENISGSGFYLGNSTIPGKDGASSGTSVWVSDPDSTEYQNDSEAYLYSPVFDFSLIGKYELSFRTNYSFEPNWDGFIVEYSTNLGESWIKLNDEIVEGWYNSISDPQAVFGAEVPFFSGNTSGNFDEVNTDVSFLGGESSVSFRIVFLTDAATVDAGMAIDDFSLFGPEPGDVSVDILSTQTAGIANCEGQVITFEADVAGSVVVVDWNFGIGAIPETATGIGPHEVSFEIGSNQVVLRVENLDGEVFIQDTSILTSSNHVVEITAENNGDGTITLMSSPGDSYQWLFNGEAIVGANEQSFLADQDGEYSVEVLVNQCLATSAFEKVIVTKEEEQVNNLGIYPNPVLNYMTVNSTDYFDELVLLDINGKQILTHRLERASKIFDVNLSHVSPGLYMMKFYKSGKMKAEIKILKK